MSVSVGQIQLDLGINQKGFKKSVDGITALASKAGTALASAFAVGEIIKFGKACLELGSNLSEVQNVVDVTFGNMSGNINDFAKNAMLNFGLSETLAKQMTGTFGSMAKAFDFSTAQAYEMSTTLTGLAGDVASYYNMSANEAQTMLKSIFSGETESLKNIGVVMTQSALDQYALANGFGRTTAAMSEQQKVSLRYSFVLDKLGAVSGDFVRTQDSWANQTRVLSLQWDAFRASIGQALINVLTPAIKALNELMVVVNRAAAAFASFTTAVFGDAGSGSGAVTAVSEQMDMATLSTNAASDAAAAYKKQLMGFDELNIIPQGSAQTSLPVSTGVSGASEILPQETEKANTQLDSIKKKLLEIASITGLDYVFANFQKSCDNVRIASKSVFETLFSVINEKKPQIEEAFSSLGASLALIPRTLGAIMSESRLIATQGILDFVNGNTAEIERFFAGLVDLSTQYTGLISTVIGDAFSDIFDWWQAEGKPIYENIVLALEDVASVCLKVWNEHLQPVVSSAIEQGHILWDENLRPLLGKMMEYVGSVGELVTTVWEHQLKPVIDWASTQIMPRIAPVLDWIVRSVREGVAQIATIISGVYDIFIGINNFLTGVFSGNWQKAWDGMRKVFAGFATSLKALFISPLNVIIDGINTFMRGINKMKIPSWVPGIGGNSFNFKEIPRLASGGYVRANTPQLAIIGDNRREGEIVAPESKIAQAVAAGISTALSKSALAQNTGTSEIVVMLDSDVLFRQMVRQNNSTVIRTGESPLLT